jgi:hypothetical protein
VAGKLSSSSKQEKCVCCNLDDKAQSSLPCRTCKKWTCKKCLSKGKCHFCEGKDECPVAQSKINLPVEEL